MSTRSNIGLIKKNGEVQVAYCHHDGYPDWVGRIMKNHMPLERIKKILKEADEYSSIHETGEAPYDDAKNYQGRTYDSLEDYIDDMKDSYDIEYIYLIDEESGKLVSYENNSNKLEKIELEDYLPLDKEDNKCIRDNAEC